MKYGTILLLAAAAFSVSAAQAASFSCEKPQHADEKTICAHRDLNDKDVEMATQYRFLKGLFAMGGRGAFQDQQQAWLKQRRACATDTRCLNQRYDERLKQMADVYGRINRPLF